MISSYLLIDTVTHSPLTQGSRGDTFGPDATIENVCLQHQNVRTFIDGSAIVTSNDIMFWDASLSTSAKFRIGDKITYTDKHTGDTIVRYVDDVNVLQTTAFHHVEVMLK